jgi:hypothetical protein
MKLKLLFAVLLCTLLGCNQNPDVNKKEQEALLRIYFAKGLKQEVTYTARTYIAGKGSMDEEVVMTYGLEAATDAGGGEENYVFTGRLNSVKMTSGLFGKKTAYDSSDPAKNKGESLLQLEAEPVKGKEFTFSANSRGNVLKTFTFKGSDSQYQPIPLLLYFVKLPEKAIKKGMVWEDTLKDPETGKAAKATYRIALVNQDWVQVNAVLVSEDKSQRTYSCTYVVNANTGLINSGNIQIGAEGVINFTVKTI